MNADCDHVSPECPVSLTLYGDYFTLGATVTYASLFAVMLAAQGVFAYRSKLWSFGAWLFTGTAFEFIGYVCRSFMVDNPWNSNAFMGQALALVLGPTFVAAAISLTFKHLVLWYGPEHSLLRPKLYPYVFVGTDLISIMVQGAGGGIASAADTQSMSDVGNNIILAGVCFQVINMVFCGILILSYVWQRKKAQAESPVQTASEWAEGRRTAPPCYQGTMEQVQNLQHKAKIFIVGLAVAYVAILARCIYRIPEMAMGWGSSLMRNETTFMILDGGLLLIACGTLTVFHPAFWFTPLGKTGDSAKADDEEVEMSSREGLAQRDSGEQQNRKP